MLAESKLGLNPGPDDDQVRILIDGQNVGQCFTTWETYRRTAPERAPPPPGGNSGMPPAINSLQFRTSVPGFMRSLGGYLFDNVTTTTGTGPTSPNCDVTIDKEADSSTVTAGGVEGYLITVHNRGRLAERNLLACDHIPREATFVSASRKLRRLGRQRCLFISRLGPGQNVSFHFMVRVNANGPRGTLDNKADVTLEPPPGAPPVTPPVPTPDLPLGGATAPVAPITKVKAAVKVVAKPAARPPAPPPSAVTG